MVVIQVFHWYSKILEGIEEGLAIMSECNCSVMWIVLLNQYVAIESAHLMDSEYTDTTEGSGSYRKNFTFCYVCTKLAISERAMINWFFISQAANFLEQVLPQWKPMKVSLCVYGNLPSMDSLYISFGTELLISRRVTISSLTQVPMYSDNAP